ncbi:MAG: hypothetical protein GKR93_15715 [Gammaproteobacteria bacterium]|nr:hypothetical protein [Gammaproteobacteria bacterium]
MNNDNQCQSIYSAISLLTLILLLNACEKNTSGYFPLQKGLIWQYSIENYAVNVHSSEKEIIQNIGSEGSGTDKVFVNNSVTGLRSYYQQNDEAVLLKYQILPDGTRIEPGDIRATIFRYPLQTGNSWKGVMTTNSLQSYDAHAHAVLEDIPVSVSIEAMDETIVVDAGKFRNCMRIVSKGEKVVAKGKYAYQPKMTISITNTRWYAEGIGLIKEEHIEDSDILQYTKAIYIVTLDKFTPN